MVSFKESDEKYNTVAMAQQLDRRLQQLIRLGNSARQLDDSIAASPAFLERSDKEKRAELLDEGFDLGSKLPVGF